MTRRVTIPDDHVALILPNQLADEIMSLLTAYRTRLWSRIERQKRAALDASEHGDPIKDLDASDVGAHAICGDVMLAVLEAKEV